MPKAFFFVLVRHDEGVGESSKDRDAETLAGLDVGRAGATTDVRGARSQGSRFRAMGAPGAEFDDRAALGSFDYARSFRRNHRLKSQG